LESTLLNWPVSKLKATLTDMGLAGKVANCVEKTELIGVACDAFQMVFCGKWHSDAGVIHMGPDTARWDDGFQVKYSRDDIDKVSLEWEGVELTGVLDGDKLIWNDGDTWHRVGRSECAGSVPEAPSTPPRPAGRVSTSPKVRKKSKSFLRTSIGNMRRLSILRQRAGTPQRLSRCRMYPQKQRQRQELARIAKAKRSLQVLGFDEGSRIARHGVNDLEAFRQQDDWRLLVQRRYRELTRLLHPDKCPPELKSEATVVFRRIVAAKTDLLDAK